MSEINIISNRDFENLTATKKKEYLTKLREQLTNDKKNISANFGHELITKLYPFLRNYQLETRGEENIPNGDSAIFMCNHSNSHDYFTAHEAFEKVGRSISVFAAKDGITPLVKTIFSVSDATLIDRRSKESANTGTIEFAKKIIEGRCGIIFGESTWNLHPIKPMQTLKIGGARIGSITQKCIIPTIFEYVEVSDIVEKESDLYSKCIIYFGKPIYIDLEQSLVAQTINIQRVMELMRLELWKEIGIRKTSLDDINPELYVNHTYLKKFKAFGYTYDSEIESKYLYSKNGEIVENEYCIDENGNFVPGVIPKKIK